MKCSKNFVNGVVGRVFLVLLLAWAGVYFYQKSLVDPQRIGTVVDEYNGVEVYYNGMVGHVSGRNVAPDGYNLGLRYQCVEFIKRYFYERFGHKMPDSYGHAKDFFDVKIDDGGFNSRRNMVQFANGSVTKPQADDLVVFGGHFFNRYGHVAVISEVTEHDIEIVQQNPGPNRPSRERFALSYENGVWRIEASRLLGFLRIVQPQ